MPPPTESRILTQTLLPPSSLPTILSLKAFTALFPTAHRSSPAIPHLYRSLQHRRALDLDLVRQNIAAEVQRGEAQLRELVRSRARDTEAARGEGAGGGVEDIGLGLGLGLADAEGGHGTGTAGHAREEAPRAHTAASIVPALEAAVRDLEAEVRGLEEERAEVEREMDGIVGGLSDLRYGKAREGEAEETVEMLQELEKELDRLEEREGKGGFAGGRGPGMGID